jgi:transcriptional regulator with XRE-family HTH domain
MNDLKRNSVPFTVAIHEVKSLAEVKEMIKEIREELGLSQAEIGDILGVTRQNVSQIERHQRRLTREGAERISAMLEDLGASISADTILGCQLHIWCTKKIEPIRDESKTPGEKVELLTDVADVLEQIENLDDAEEDIRQGAREKRKDVQNALDTIERWTEKNISLPDVTEELAKIG